MRSASVILCVIGSTVPVLTAQLASAQSPAAAHGQKDHNPFAGKVLVFQTHDFGLETHEDVRIASLEGTGFFVLRPIVVTRHGGKTYPKQQVWRKTSTLRSLYVFETRTAADAFTKGQRTRIAKLNPGYRPPQLEFLPHPASGNEAFNGKAVVVHWGNEIPILTNDLKIHSMGNEAFFSWSSDQLKGARVWKPLSIVDRIVVFDSFADARSHFDAYMAPSELKGEKADSDTDQEQR